MHSFITLPNLILMEGVELDFHLSWIGVLHIVHVGLRDRWFVGHLGVGIAFGLGKRLIL